MQKIKVNKVIGFDADKDKNYLTVEFENGLTLKRSYKTVINDLKKTERVCEATGVKIPKGKPVIRMLANYKGMSAYWFSPDCLSAQDERQENELLNAVRSTESYFEDKYNTTIKGISSAEKEVKRLKLKKEKLGKLLSRAYALAQDLEEVMD